MKRPDPVCLNPSAVPLGRLVFWRASSCLPYRETTNGRFPLNQTVVNLTLTASGEVEQSRTLPQHLPPAAGLSYPVKSPLVLAPVREWHFDESSGEVTAETATP